MPGVFSLSADNQTLVAAPQLCWLNPAAAPAPGIELIRAWCSQRANVTSAQQGISLGTKVTAFPTMVGATPGKTNKSDGVSSLVSGTGAAGTAGVNSSANGAGTEIPLYPDNFNVINGWLWVPTVRESIKVRGGELSGIFSQFTAAPGTASGWTFGFIFAEG